MPWGGPEVANLTRQRAAEVGLALIEWPAYADIDEPGDLVRLAGSELSAWASLAPN